MMYGSLYASCLIRKDLLHKALGSCSMYLVELVALATVLYRSCCCSYTLFIVIVMTSLLNLNADLETSDVLRLVEALC